jgi:inosose dehydratase
MELSIGGAPCSWGVESSNDPRNPTWTRVLDEVRLAGLSGLELGPIGFMPEDPQVLGAALTERGLSLTAGVVFQPFHDPAKWGDVRDAAERTCRAVKAHGAKRLVLADSISARREPTAGRAAEAERMQGAELAGLLDRVRTVARMGAEEFGLSVTLHAHAAGWIEFEDELERAIEAIDPKILGVCVDTGHSLYAGFDPVAFYHRHADRVSHLHFKDIDPTVKARVIANRIGFFDACAQGLFCNLGKGLVDFAALRAALERGGYAGWATIEQDCAPDGPTSHLDDAKANLAHLVEVGLA